MPRILLLILMAVLLLIAGLVAACNYYVSRGGKGRLYSSVSQIPERKVGLLLGTVEQLRGGGPNPFFKNRIDAAVELYKKGKVRHLLVSGDNHRRGYNEPEDMYKALLTKGVPAGAITRDYAGLRTLDSVVRAKEVFGVNTLTIISQRDHDQRALLIADQKGLDAIAFCAREVPFRNSVRAHIHEYFARVKVVLDLYVLHTKPRHIGSRVMIPVK
jgi:SanA protein